MCELKPSYHYCYCHPAVLSSALQYLATICCISNNFCNIVSIMSTFFDLPTDLTRHLHVLSSGLMFTAHSQTFAYNTAIIRIVIIRSSNLHRTNGCSFALQNLFRLDPNKRVISYLLWMQSHNIKISYFTLVSPILVQALAVTSM